MYKATITLIYKNFVFFIYLTLNYVSHKFLQAENDAAIENILALKFPR